MTTLKNILKSDFTKDAEKLMEQELEKLKTEKRDAKRQMFLTRPLRGYLGNQYEYWKGRWESLKEQIKGFKKTNLV